MSQNPSAPHPESRSPTDNRTATLPALQPRDDQQQQHGRQAEGQSMQQDFGWQLPTQFSDQQMTVHEYQATGPGEGQTSASTTPRGLGVHNILNPAEPAHPPAQQLHLGRGVKRSPPPPPPQFPPHPGVRPLSSFPPGNDGRPPVEPISPPEGHGSSSGRPRKILVPKSPRATSLGSRAAATLRSAQESPFVPDRGHVYTAQPGTGEMSDVPPLPALSGINRPFAFPPPGPPPSLRRRASVATIGAAAHPPHSQSGSPSPSYSPYSGQSHTSPVPRYPTQLPPSSSYFPGSTLSAPLREGSPSQTAPPGTEGPYMNPLSESIFFRGSPSGGHSSNIRMMPISTEHGPVFMPVDVQAASKVADEKRARNAGASARFRQRRKEKEKEASTNIQKLEQQSRDLERRAREMEQERDFYRSASDFYRSERDRFRDLVFRTPSLKNFAMQAPPSPRLPRPPTFAPPPPAPPGPIYQPIEPVRPQDDRPSRRRRTETQGEYGFELTGAPNLPPIQGSGTGYRPGPGPGPVPSGANLPPLRIENVSGPGTSIMGSPSNIAAPTTRPPPFEQYQRSGYERGWPGSQSEGDQRK